MSKHWRKPVGLSDKAWIPPAARWEQRASIQNLIFLNRQYTRQNAHIIWLEVTFHCMHFFRKRVHSVCMYAKFHIHINFSQWHVIFGCHHHRLCFKEKEFDKWNYTSYGLQKCLYNILVTKCYLFSSEQIDRARFNIPLTTMQYETNTHKIHTDKCK